MSTESDAATDVDDQPSVPEPSDTVRMFVSDDLISIEPEATLRQVAQRLSAEGVGALVVTDGERVIGIISERDVVRAVAAGKDLDATTAAELGCAPDDGALRAAPVGRGPHWPYRDGFGPRPPWCLRRLKHADVRECAATAHRPSMSSGRDKVEEIRRERSNLPRILLGVGD